MTKLTIVQDGVQYHDFGRVHSPQKGDFVLVSRESVVESLVKAKLAVHGLDAKGGMTVADPEPVLKATGASQAVSGDGEGEEGTGEPEISSEKATWDDVEGISRESRALLKENGPTADPLTITHDELLQLLDNSTRRTGHAWKALEAWRESRGRSSGVGDD